jgi:hypothetical protein
MNWKLLVTSAALTGSALVGCNTPAAGPVCGNTMCETGETTASCAVDCPAPMTRTYVVSTIDTSTPPGGTMAYGFDLDDSVGGIAGQACTSAPDFTSSVTGDEGVDNQLSTVLPTLDMQIGEGGVNGAIQEQIQGGTLLLVFEVSEINSFANDTSVMVHIALGAVPTGATIQTAGTGLAADQTFTEMMDLGTVSGSITAGRLRAETPTLPLSFAVMGANVTLTLRQVVVGGSISDAGGFTHGEFGAVVSVDDVVSLAMMFLPGTDRATVEALVMPDIDPADAAGEHCDSISAGLGFESVEATLE